MDYRSYAAQPAQAGLPDLTGDSSPYDDSGVEAPRPLCRAQLLYMEQGLDKQYAIGERDQVHPGPGQWSGEELIPYLVSEIKRLRHLVLANETLAHIESVAWWYRDTYPTTLENYLDMSKSAF